MARLSVPHAIREWDARNYNRLRVPVFFDIAKLTKKISPGAVM